MDHLWGQGSTPVKAFLARWGDGCGGMMGYYGFGGMFMGFIFLVMIVLIVYLVIAAARSHGQGGPGQEKPIDILKQRYARGEITREQYEQMKKDLEQ